MTRALLMRELKLASRIGGGAELGLMFFLILVAIIPFAIGPDAKVLSKLAPAILWIAALLAMLLGLDRLFQADEDEGVLDLCSLSSTPLELIILVKAFAHWLTTGLPLALAAPLFGLMLSLEPSLMLSLVVTLLIGTPALTLIGMVGAALTVSLRRGGMLLSVLILPFTIPVLIFGVAAINNDEILNAPLWFLSAISLVMLVIAPIASAAALRLGRE
jgi:heme exporter protein B